ncbi:MAG TPA: TetR family transcriptional regulator [Acidimicrobiales bacterium]|nr:TetR family transcriptional regulator [Acidimicrobiales bacterium]
MTAQTPFDYDAERGTAGVETLRDRKKHATRLALQAAALDLVATRGYAQVTVEEIAEAADVSPRTFFNYFSSKEAAVLGEDPEQVDELRASILARPADEPPFETVRAVLSERAASVARAVGGAGDTAAWLRRMKAVHAEPHLRVAHVARMAAFERVVAEAVAERTGADLETDLYPSLLAATAMASARVTLGLWARTGGTGSIADLVDRTFSLLGAGLARSVPEDPAREAPGPRPAHGQRRTTAKASRS